MASTPLPLDSKAVRDDPDAVASQAPAPSSPTFSDKRTLSTETPPLPPSRRSIFCHRPPFTILLFLSGLAICGLMIANNPNFLSWARAKLAEWRANKEFRESCQKMIRLNKDHTLQVVRTYTVLSLLADPEGIGGRRNPRSGVLQPTLDPPAHVHSKAHGFPRQSLLVSRRLEKQNGNMRDRFFVGILSTDCTGSGINRYALRFRSVWLPALHLGAVAGNCFFRCVLVVCVFLGRGCDLSVLPRALDGEV